MMMMMMMMMWWDPCDEHGGVASWCVRGGISATTRREPRPPSMPATCQGGGWIERRVRPPAPHQSSILTAREEERCMER